MKLEKSLCDIIVKYEDVKFDDNTVAEQVREHSVQIHVALVLRRSLRCGDQVPVSCACQVNDGVTKQSFRNSDASGGLSQSAKYAF